MLFNLHGAPLQDCYVGNDQKIVRTKPSVALERLGEHYSQMPIKLSH